eukprot:CAMPEP_0116871446 /NCGR_PEP_ID=MMETSP0463-20121206/1810_1 /TAXON_ID=181622 /ORGANISM="Strombidinopsis sp, Strain SopsisLIS2011" /LENGTH=51 /DNA_ID=CAMNT_0004509903 /DNA_START=1078 /DNA_END=1233 /DNA_ORIENTATION=+
MLLANDLVLVYKGPLCIFARFLMRYDIIINTGHRLLLIGHHEVLSKEIVEE